MLHGPPTESKTTHQHTNRITASCGLITAHAGAVLRWYCCCSFGIVPHNQIRSVSLCLNYSLFQYHSRITPCISLGMGLTKIGENVCVQTLAHTLTDFLAQKNEFLPSTNDVSKVIVAAFLLPAGKLRPILSSLSRNARPPFFDLALRIHYLTETIF